MWCPITLEFEIVGNANDCVISPGAAGGASNIDTTNTTTSWSIEQVQLKCDLVTLDSALQNSYADHVLSGKALPIKYSTYVTQHQSLANGLPLTTNVSSAVSRLKSVFINLDGDRAAINNAFPITFARKDFNAFMHPMIGDYNFGNELQLSLQIGSKRFPEYPMMSASESYYQLKKSLGIHGSAFHSISPTYRQYICDHFIVGFDTEKILEAGFSGLNTRAGDLMVIKAQGANNGSLVNTRWTDFATKLHVILHSDQILEIRDTGSQVFD